MSGAPPSTKHEIRMDRSERPAPTSRPSGAPVRPRLVDDAAWDQAVDRASRDHVELIKKLAK